jgi:hypothetical protein
MIIIRHAATSSLPFFPPPLATYSSSFLNWNLCETTIPRAHPQPPPAPRTTGCRHSVAEKNRQNSCRRKSSHNVAAAPFSSCAATESPHLLQHREQRRARTQSRPLDIRIDGPGWAWESWLCLDQTLSLLTVTRSSATGDIRWLEVGGLYGFHKICHENRVHA